MITIFLESEKFSHKAGVTKHATNSLARKSHLTVINPPLSEFVGGMTDDLGGSHITEYVSDAPKNYAIRTADGTQIVKVKGFTLNYVASKQLNFDVMKDMAISDEQHSVKIVGTSEIKKDLKRRQINTLPSSKSKQPYQFTIWFC